MDTMKKLLFITFVTLAFSFTAFAQEPGEGDIQFWHETTVTIPVYKTTDSKGKKSERVNLFFNGVLRFGGNLTQAVDERAGFGIEFKPNKWLTLTPSYLFRRDQPIVGRHGQENRLRFAVTLEKKFAKFTLKDRNLVERRFRRNVADSTRYRNRLGISIPVLKDKKEIFSFFVNDEVYYDFLAKHWTRNEFSPGISRKINKNLTTEFFYMLQTNRSLPLKRINAFGVNLRIKLD